VPDQPANVPPPQPSRPGANAPEMTVSELSGAIKRALEDGFGYVRLRARSRATAGRMPRVIATSR